VGATTVPGFAAGTLIYDVVLPVGTTVVPVLSATVTEAHATAVITQTASVTGVASVMVMAQDGVTMVTYTVNFSVSTGINEILADQLKLNMQGSILKVELPNTINDLQVVTLEGKLILFEKIDFTETSINTANWNSGVYILRINAHNGVVTKKIVVK